MGEATSDEKFSKNEFCPDCEQGIKRCPRCGRAIPDYNPYPWRYVDIIPDWPRVPWQSPYITYTCNNAY